MNQANERPGSDALSRKSCTMKASMARPFNTGLPNGTVSPRALIESGFPDKKMIRTNGPDGLNISEDVQVDPSSGLAKLECCRLVTYMIPNGRD